LYGTAQAIQKLMKFKIPEVDDPMRFPKAARRALAQREEAVLKAHWEHIERLQPLLPPALQTLNSFSLDDGLLQYLRIDPEQKTLELVLEVGDSRRGCFAMTLLYKGITLAPHEVVILCLLAERVQLGRGNHDIAWGELELDEAPDGSRQYTHRILWRDIASSWRFPKTERSAPVEPELTLRFLDLELEMVPVTKKTWKQARNPVVVVRDQEKFENELMAQILAEAGETKKQRD
jgi:hypothetical protein